MDFTNHRFFIGTKSGVLLSLHNNFKTTEFWKTEGSSGITVIENGRNSDELVLGHENGTISVFSIDSSTVNETITGLAGKERITGIGALNDIIVSSKLDGVINFWNRDDVYSFSINLPSDGRLNAMVLHPTDRNFAAIGGERNDYQLWDLDNKKNVFKAKSLGNDILQLPIPTSIRGICFFDNEPTLGACCTKEGHVLLYDSNAQRKPIVKFREEKASYTTIKTAHREMQVIVGTTKGYMQIIDLRSPGKVLKTFTKFLGSITGIACDAEKPFVTSVGLDRFLRVYNLETSELVQKRYLQQNLSALLIKEVFEDEETDQGLNSSKEPRALRAKADLPHLLN